MNSAERAKQPAAWNPDRRYRNRCVGRLPRLFPGRGRRFGESGEQRVVANSARGVRAGRSAEKHRAYDAALLFLIYPLSVVDDKTADLMSAARSKSCGRPLGSSGTSGIRFIARITSLRWNGARRSNANFSDDLASRNELLREGEGPVVHLRSRPLRSLRPPLPPNENRRRPPATNRVLQPFARTHHATTIRRGLCGFPMSGALLFRTRPMTNQQSHAALVGQANLWTALEACSKASGCGDFRFADAPPRCPGAATEKF